jgi:predicted transglutaminase-like cysteine proteinase
MSGFGRSSELSRLLTIAFVLSVVIGDQVAAKPEAKKPHRASEPAATITAIPSSPTTARFFTINQVLAKHEGRVEPTNPFRVAAAISTENISDAPNLVPEDRKSSDGPFGLVTFRAPEGPLWVKWRGVQANIQLEDEVLAQCRNELERCASPAARQLLAIAEKAREHSGRARIDTVNRLINGAIRYTSDLEQHGRIDVWLSPLATLASGRGDCKDYAIAKYVALREAGIAADDLQLLLVHDRLVQQDHAVVAVRDAGRWLILDNRHSVLQEDTEIHQFTLLFAIDDQGVKLFATPYTSRSIYQRDDDSAPAMFGFDMALLGPSRRAATSSL